jgi:xanthine dehydrogenase accessory factor
MREMLSRMLALEREGRRFVVATVVRTQGSTPQVVGARLIVDDRDERSGTLGGGCVEGDAISEARRVLAEGGSSLRAYELTEPLAWDTGLVCGGTMWIHIEPDAALLRTEWADRLRAAIQNGGTDKPIALGTNLTVHGRSVTAEGHRLIDRAETIGPLPEKSRRLLEDAFDHGVARAIPLDEGHELLVEPILARPQLVIAGGGHVALALAKMAQMLDYDITVIEDREEFAQSSRFPGIRVLQGDIADTLAGLQPPWNSFIVVATRGHKLDAHCLRAAVKTQARYVGLLGSKRKTILIAKMLRDEGIGEERLRAVHAPIGLDLGGRTPGEIALSVLAELSQERFGGSGKPLRLSEREATLA